MADVGDALANVAVWDCRVGSWLGGKFLGMVPVNSGSLTWSKDRDVPGSITLEVPAEVDGVSWVPGDDPAHPLALFGQELTVDVTVSDPATNAEQGFQLGRFVNQNWDSDTGGVGVNASSMFSRVEDDRFTSPAATKTNGTLASEARRLTPDLCDVQIDDALTDRAVPSMSWDESRIDSLKELAEAWPARLRESREGTIQFLAPIETITTPELRFTDGEGGTVIEVASSDSRDAIYNVVVARGQETGEDGSPTFQGIAAQNSGPLAVSGPYGRVPRFFSSPLITSKSAALKSAQTMLKNSISSSKILRVTAAPDPRVWLDVPVAVIRDGVEQWGLISGFTLPLLGDADMTVDVEVF